MNPTTLTQSAIDSLHTAAINQQNSARSLNEERNILRPDSWLIQRCWQALADAGAGMEAMAVAQLAGSRQPLSSLQVIHRIAQKASDRPWLLSLVQTELDKHQPALFAPPRSSQRPHERTHQIDGLLLAAASAAHIGRSTLAFAYLERLDQIPKCWDRVFINPETRILLTETITRIGLHPLTVQLIVDSIRRFSDSGAQFLQKIAELLVEYEQGNVLVPHADRLLLRCVDTLRHATLIGLHSRRVAVSVMAQAGLADEVLGQMATIAAIQDAHRETRPFQHSSLSPRESDSGILRQVIRPKANADIDFQVHALQGAIAVLPKERIPQTLLTSIAQQLAMLGGQSDGWTAAGAASALVKLGAIQYAVDVINNISPHDPTRSEGVIALVKALLANGQEQIASEQTQRAFKWAVSLPERTPMRALTWGLAEVYLNHNLPDRALGFLGRRPQPSFLDRLRHFFREDFTDEDLRTERLRLHALLLQYNEVSPAVEPPSEDLPDEPRVLLEQEIQTLLNRLQSWAPRLLEGEALVGFLMEGILQPLLTVGRMADAWRFLPDLSKALSTIRGNRHATRVAEATQLLAKQLDPSQIQADPIQADTMRAAFVQFCTDLWRYNTQRSLWQAVYGVEGCLLLLIILDGPQSAVEIAHAAGNAGEEWDALFAIPDKQDEPIPGQVPRNRVYAATRSGAYSELHRQ